MATLKYFKLHRDDNFTASIQLTYDTTFQQHVCMLIALTHKTYLNQANVNQVLAIFCKIDGFNRADFFVHPCPS